MKLIILSFLLSCLLFVGATPAKADSTCIERNQNAVTKTTDLLASLGKDFEIIENADIPKNPSDWADIFDTVDSVLIHSDKLLIYSSAVEECYPGYETVQEARFLAKKGIENHKEFRDFLLDNLFQ